MLHFLLHEVQIIATVIRGQLRSDKDTWIIEQRSSNGKLQQLITIYPRIAYGEHESALVTVQSSQGFQQLFGCTGYIILEPDEVLFLAPNDTHVSCLVIGAERTATLFASVPLCLLHKPLDELDPITVLAVMQISLAEHLLPGVNNGA